MDLSFLPSVWAATATGPNEGDAAFAHTEAISWSPGAHPQGSHLGLLFVKENSRGGRVLLGALIILVGCGLQEDLTSIPSGGAPIASPRLWGLEAGR